MNVVTDIAGPAVTWTAWNIAVAVAVPRLPASWFGRQDSRPRRAPRRRILLAVRPWKHMLPDAGAWLPGGSPKRHLPARDRAALTRYAQAVRGGEVVHWLSLLAAPVLAWWWPVVVVGPLTIVAIVLNVPCIVVLRFNHDRIQRVLTRPRRPATGFAKLGVSRPRTAARCPGEQRKPMAVRAVID